MEDSVIFLLLIFYRTTVKKNPIMQVNTCCMMGKNSVLVCQAT